MTQSGRWFLVAFALLGAAVAEPARAGASCPPAPISEFVADLAAGRFRMPEGLDVAPHTGRVPLQVRMSWGSQPVADPVLFEIDADNDGKAEWSDTDQPRQQAHTFTRPGTHTVTARVTDRTGRVVTYAVPVEVRAAAPFDAEMSARWATFKTALARRDVSQALECVVAQERDHAREVLSRPGNPLVSEFLVHADTLTFLGRAGGIDLEYRTDFVGGGPALLIVFSLDIDSLWRIRARNWQ